MRSIAAAVLLPALAVLAAAGPARADETTGTVLAYDRLANVIVLRDRTVWQLAATLTVPEDLKAGDRIRIQSAPQGEDGVDKITALTRLDPK